MTPANNNRPPMPIIKIPLDMARVIDSNLPRRDILRYMSQQDEAAILAFRGLLITAEFKAERDGERS